ncbi:Uncharacterised protein [Vibrio cholerae]|nr:Uncharacterised protein [Vibrio cholerae]
MQGAIKTIAADQHFAALLHRLFHLCMNARIFNRFTDGTVTF